MEFRPKSSVSLANHSVKKSRFAVNFFFCTLILSLSGCGYTNRAILPNNIRSIAVLPFENEIPLQETFTYQSGLEIDVTEKVIDRILFDGNLKVANINKADARLEGKLTNYYQEATRLNSLDGVSEYRLYMVCHLKLIDQRTNALIWEEPSFSGDTEYFVEGADAKPESTAVKAVMEDLAKNIVDRIVEDW
ncbi:MAG: LptE family protein [Candidatus Omnitrophica bacterium]|nr:LptE family protein [Candidatus Omnitrophota bacterium]